MTCKGICSRYKVTIKYHAPRYGPSMKYCNHCVMRINWSGTWCPCCGYRVRNKRRATTPGAVKRRDRDIKRI